MKSTKLECKHCKHYDGCIIIKEGKKLECPIRIWMIVANQLLGN